MSKWTESEVLTDRKSKFQARCIALTDPNEVPNLLQTLLAQNKAVSRASHPHMFAWRTAEVKETEVSSKKAAAKLNKNNKNQQQGSAKSKSIEIKNIMQGSADGGEANAGQRLLTLLERSQLVNVLVIVTRWYGGVPLGSARFRHITTTAVDCLKKAGFLR